MLFRSIGQISAMSGIKRTGGDGKRSINAVAAAMGADNVAVAALREDADDGTAL